MKSVASWFTKPSVTTTAVVASIVAVSLASGVMLQKKAENALHHEVRQNLVRLARIAALQVDGDRHLQWKPEDALTPEYQKAIAPFYRLMEASRDIYDIYTCVLRDGKVYFVLGTPDYDPKTGEPDYSYLYEPYDEATPEMLRALRQGITIAENRLYTDQWGTVISGYAPIRDSAGNMVGIVGVDLHVNEYRKRLEAIRRHAHITYAFIGSGLGLAINRQLVTLMGGSIGVHSEEGKGSTFWVILPLFVPDVEQSRGMVSGDLPGRQGRADQGDLSAPARAARRVLLVEDNEVNRKVAVRLLQRLGYEVDVASDGVEAVEKTTRQHYDAVLMDVHMPRMDGLEATRIIRDRERSMGRHQVIIAMTASVMKEEVQRCLASGMDDYLSKPVKVEVLQEMLEKWQDAGWPARSVDLPPIDRDFLAEMTGGDPEFEQELLQEFLNTIPGLMQQVREAVESGNNTALASAAHTIKGSARAVGAQTLAEIAFALELAGKEQRIDDASDTVTSLFTEWQRVQEYIEQQLLRRAA